MLTTFLRHLAALVTGACLFAAAAGAAEPFAIRAGDRVMLIGDTWFEREGVAAALETRLYQRWAPLAFSVRNLSFAADRPDGVSRASFDPPAAGFARLKEQLSLVKPTVAIVGYGMAAALEELTYRSQDWMLNPDPARYGSEFTAERFKRDLTGLLEAIAAAGGGEVRVVLVAPIRPEDLRATRPALPDPAALRQVLAGYAAAIAAVAKERGARLVDTPALVPEGRLLTTNGIHPTAAGLEQWAELVANDLGWSAGAGGAWTPARLSGLRALLARKNDLFFHRWRPANHTYLFGFRKHEQGRNAAEMPMFDELLVKADAAIATVVAGGEAPPLPVKPASLPVQDAAPDPGFQVGEGLAAGVWVANPMISKPVHLAWDASGRMWIASTPIYPQIEPGALASDRIFIVEDTDRDGTADRSAVFADDLLIPTGIAPIDRVDGRFEAYVGASTDLLLISDSDGDGKADTRRAVLSGFGTEDTHHTVHTLYWGHDGRLYFNQSVYIHSHLETPWGVVRLNAGGVFAYDPASERVEVLIKGLWNTWGHRMDAAGQSFFTDGAGSSGITWGFPGGVFNPSEGAKATAPGVSPGSYPKFCGLELVHSPLFPADWQGDAITCDFRAHRMVRMDLADKPGAAGYVTSDQPDLLRTGDAWFRPIDVKHGPDGALYIADWTNPVINHGEVDFRDQRRDKVHGRVWRVAPTAVAPLAWKPVAGRALGELHAALLSPSGWERDSARRVLASRLDDKAATALRAWATADGTPPALLAAANVLRASGRHAAALELVTTAPALRATAARWLGDAAAADRVARLAALAVDPSPRVRLEAMRALARIGGVPAAEAALAAAERIPADDAHYAFATRATLASLAAPWVAAVADGSWNPAGREATLAAGLLALPSADAAPGVQRVLAGRADLAQEPWVSLLAHAGDAAAVGALAASLPGALDAKSLERALRALVDAAGRGVVPAGAVAAPPLTHADQAVRRQAVRLAGAWKRADLAPALRDAAGDAALHGDVVAALKAIGGESAAGTLRLLMASASGIKERTATLAALATVDGKQALAVIATLITPATSEAEAATLWRALWPAGGVIDRVVADGLPAGLPPAGIAGGLVSARELGDRGKKLAALFEAAKAPVAAVVEVDEPEDLAGWAALTQKSGDAERGEALYFSAGQSCVQCHAIGGAGGLLGPDMSTLGASAPLDYIIESVIDPAAKVKEGYHMVTFRLKDGGTVTGIPAGETEKEIRVRLPGAEQLVAKNAIVGRDAGGGSLMPPGLVAQLPAADRADLFAFLAALGKPGRFDASDGTVMRAWRLSVDLPEGSAPALGAMPVVYALVDGRVLPQAWPAALAALPGDGPVYALTQVDVPAAGLLTLTFLGTDRPWIDGIFLDPGEKSRQVAAGRHTLAVRVNRQSPPKVLRMQVNVGRFVAP